MITKSDLKYYSSLLQKKYRKEENRFIVEGKKLVEEAINSNFSIERIFVSTFFSESQNDFLKDISGFQIDVLHNKDFLKLTDTENPQGIAAIVKIPSRKFVSENSKLIIALENISDPGNLGTIIRTCDWFGFNQILLSENSVELFNPKVIRASMGSIFHLNIFETNDFINDLKDFQKKDFSILCADIEGENIFEFSNSNIKKSILVFCNEANGPSKELLKIIARKITIPKFGNAESLNVASAAAIILAETSKLKLR